MNHQLDPIHRMAPMMATQMCALESSLVELESLHSEENAIVRQIYAGHQKLHPIYLISCENGDGNWMQMSESRADNISKC